MAIEKLTIDEAALDKLVKQLGEGFAEKRIRRGMERGLLAIHQRIPPYPPPRQMKAVTKRSSLYRRGGHAVAGRGGRWWASSYRRTGTLGKSITEKATHDGHDVIGYLGTNVSVKTNSSGYAQYVIGQNQAWMHVGRWWRLYDEVTKRIDLVSREIDREIQDGLEE